MNNFSRFLLTTIFLLTRAAPAHAAFDPTPSGATPIGMGTAFVGLAEGSQSLFWNPAGLARAEGQSAGSSYFRPYGMEELGMTAMHLSSQTRFGAVGFGYQGYGDDLYSETGYTIGYARALFDRLYLGFAFRYMQVSAKGYGEDSAMGVDLGISTQIDPRLRIGMIATNINSPSISENNEAIPQIFAVGVAYRLRPDFRISFDLRKDIEFPLQFCTGLEYRPISLLALRLGGHNEPEQFSAGFGIRGPATLRALQLDYAFQTHRTLDSTHHFSISFRFGDARSPIEQKAEKKLVAKSTDASSMPNEQILISLNQADAKALKSLPGIGKKTASNIIAYRLEHGPFEKINDLKKVEGIGQKMLEKILPYLTID